MEVLGSPEVAEGDQGALRQRVARARAQERSAEEALAERVIDGKPVVWAPQPGSQELFLQCPLFEVLYHGTRGPGKSDALLMAFAQHVGRGFGEAWRGVIFRRTYPELADIVAKSERWFRRIFPTAKFNRQQMLWTFPDGEALMFRHMRVQDDYWHYHGHELPFIGWEELTNWPDDTCYKRMISCCRTSTPGVPRMIRSTTNPYGVGHQWVRDRFRLHGSWWEPTVTTNSVDETGAIEPPRAAIHGHIDENKILLAADPHYKQTIAASATNESQADAWLRGSWDLIAGGMFADVWSHEYNEVGRFLVPHTWRIDRAFDWGSSKPFSVGWYAESDGSDLRFLNGTFMSTVRGDIFRVKEWYGYTGKPNVGLRMLAAEISEGIVERELLWQWRTPDVCRVRAGPADSSIFTVENGNCIATDMERPVRIGNNVYGGIPWTPADKSPGSRKVGWEIMRQAIRNAQPKDGTLPREAPGLFVVVDECPQFMRTVLSLPRDEKDMDDVDTDAEDHIGDEVRYRLRSAGLAITSGTTSGYY